MLMERRLTMSVMNWRWLLAVWLVLAWPGWVQAQSGEGGGLRQRWQERMAHTQDWTDVHARLGPGDFRFRIEHGGLTRLYRVHVPAQAQAGQPLPLLLALHGGGGNMDIQANDAFYGQITQSERRGFVVVFANGFSPLPGGQLATWNAGNCCAQARDRQVDDVGFLRQVVANVQAQLPIDPRRVYATGMSNGAMMAYRLACEASDVFRAIAAVAGTDNTRTCSPTQAVAVLHIHARDDDHVLYTGGVGPASPEASKVTDYRSVSDTVAKWTTLDACAPATRTVLATDGAVCEAHTTCRAGTQVQWCTTATGGHSWPGGRSPRGLGSPSQAMSANEVMWAFFDGL
jgi:polyhydroxybutyrate depolymerase